MLDVLQDEKELEEDARYIMLIKIDAFAKGLRIFPPPHTIAVPKNPPFYNPAGQSSNFCDSLDLNCVFIPIRAVLGGADDRNCTYNDGTNEGYLKRQVNSK